MTPEDMAREFDKNVDRLKACEHIALGEGNWQSLRNECPSTAAVAALRDQIEDLRTELNSGLPAEEFERRARLILETASNPTYPMNAVRPGSSGLGELYGPKDVDIAAANLNTKCKCGAPRGTICNNDDCPGAKAWKNFIDYFE